MRKKVIFVIVFLIISIIITNVLIILNKEKINNISNVEVIEKMVNIIKPQEKTIDLYGTFNINNIEFSKKNIYIDEIDEEISCYQICGLKDKEIEEKINNEMEEKVYNFIKSNFEKTKSEVQNINFDSLFINNGYIESNFSNVISINYSYSYYEYNEEQNFAVDVNDNLYLNYNLVNGKEIKLEDLFLNENDIETVVRMALYKNWEREELVSFEVIKKEPYYDKEKNIWFQEIGEYNESIEDYEYKTVEYIPNMTEYDIFKKVKKYMNCNEKKFCFTPSQLILKFDENEYEYKYGEIYFKDIDDKIVIYDKYLTNEKIYENNDVVRSMINCTEEGFYSKYKNTKFYNDNLFFDIDLQEYDDNDSKYYKQYAYKDYYNEKINEFYKNGIELIDEYKEISENNKNKCYFLFIEINPHRVGEYEKSYSSLISIEMNAKLIVCENYEKQEMLDKILSVYRNELRFVGSVYDALSIIEYSYDDETGDETKEVDIETIKSDEKFYNAVTGKEIKSIDDLFKEGLNYKDIIIQKLFGDEYYYGVQNDIDSLNYKMTYSGIEVTNQDEFYRLIDYGDLSEYLTIEQIKLELLPSDEIYLDDFDIQNMSKEELNYAYNEIFARHGQDFKNSKYKEYFSNICWYSPIENKNVTLDELSEIEKYNVKFLKEKIDTLE